MKTIVHSWNDASQALQMIHGGAFGTYLGINITGARIGPGDLAAILIISSGFAISAITVPSYLRLREWRLAMRNAVVGICAVPAVFFISRDSGLDGWIFVAIAGSWASLSLLFVIVGTQSDRGIFDHD